jgi:uncharacterized protein
MENKTNLKSTWFRVSGIILIIIVLCLVLYQVPKSEDVKHMESKDTIRENAGAKTEFRNRLQYEKSPYLLQHAGNPVDWFPWGEEAFAKAEKENKPIFLSIGYSTCHWCHVMEHESFEDEQVARLMNDAFVCIKVDREERPDIDNIYMTVCQMMTGGGGWPLTILMTPDKKPFYAGTYIPKITRFQRPGMLDLIPQVKSAWEERKDDILASAEQITGALQKSAGDTAGLSLGAEDLDLAYKQLSGSYDTEHGGFNDRPKFPTPHNLLFLLRYWKRSGDDKALEMVENTLQNMRLGGIYDHVGFGFHRYSTDERWFLPHFEKMLYDQAMLIMAYTEAYQATGKPEYRKTAEEVITYVLRDMASPEGAFYSAEDADSEGEEGKFYLWSEDELEHILGKDDAAFVMKTFNTEKGGSYYDEATGHNPGTNILFLKEELKDTGNWDGIREKLFDIREKRIHPYKDNKVLTDWNGLMITALAKAARTFDNPDYAKAAERSFVFIRSKLMDGDRLLHRYRDGESAVTGNVDDYAFVTWGLLELYETTFNVDYLKSAISLNDDLLTRFWDEKSGGLFFTADDAEELLIRHKDIYDGAIPSGNSAAMLNLLRLSRITGNTEYENKAQEIGRAFSSRVKQVPAGYTMLMAALDFGVGPSYEVVITGKHGSDDTNKMIDSLNSKYIPNKVVLFRPADEDIPEITGIAEYTKTQKSLNGRATAYVCLNFSCKQPTADINEMLQALSP